MNTTVRRTIAVMAVTALAAFTPPLYGYLHAVRIFHQLVGPHIPDEISNLSVTCTGSFIDVTTTVAFDFRPPAANIPTLASWQEVCASARRTPPAKDSIEEQDKLFCGKWPSGYRKDLHYLFFDDATGKGTLYSSWGEGC